MSKAELSTPEITIPQVLEKIQEQLKSFKKIETTSYKTQGTLTGFGNIHNETKVENLIKAHSSIRGRANAYKEAAEDLGLNEYPVFTVDGADAEAWKHDIDLKIQIITHKERIDKLKDIEAKAKSFLSQEDQKVIFFKELMGTLKLE